jgi:integrase/recombinase XerD
MMLEELQRRHYAQNTIRHYLRAVEEFARRFRCSPDRLGPQHIREYQAELFQKRKLSSNSVGQHLAALRFFYIKTLPKAWSIADTPYPKKARHLPTILSREEVAQLLHAARTPGERILLMTLYATGTRNSWLTHLKVSDIDSQRMVVHIRGGKGRKDRDVMLSPKLLVALRTHWRCYHRKSSSWLFPSNFSKDRPIDTKTVWYVCRKSAQGAGELGDIVLQADALAGFEQMLAANATELGIVQNQIGKLGALLHEIDFREPLDAMSEVGNADQFGKNDAGIVETQSLVKIAGQKILLHHMV